MTISVTNSFRTRDKLNVGAQSFDIQRLEILETQGVGTIAKLPFSLRILLENLLRCEDGRFVRADDIKALATWAPGAKDKEIAFMPARVLVQDFTGVPAIVDLAAMREAVNKIGGNPRRINPLFPVELVIDHSVQVDNFGTSNSFALNAELEFQRNVERYAFLRWGQTSFQNFKAVPPGTGICHQVNLEYLARVVCAVPSGNRVEAYPDSLVGTDSHTTMVNALGVFGWGVGGIEAETLAYLHFTARSHEQIALVEAYCKEQALFRTDSTPDPLFSDTLELDLSTVEPTVAGPKRPQDRVPLTKAKASFTKVVEGLPVKQAHVKNNGDSFDLSSGAVVIAAITSCTNTSNPSLMLGAGLLAKKAVERGLQVKPWVKTSLAPGSKVVTDYLAASGLNIYLDKLKFNLVGYGCTTCIGNSGPLPDAIGAAIKDNNLVAVAVLSGNRNF